MGIIYTMRFWVAALACLPVMALAEEPVHPPSTPPATPSQVCLPMASAQQAVLQLGLRDQIGTLIANAMQQAQEAAHPPQAAK